MGSPPTVPTKFAIQLFNYLTIQLFNYSPFIIQQSVHFRETASSQKLPVISMGNSRARGRQSETRRTLVWGPVEKARRTVCQAVVPVVGGLTAST